jgi:hypothetical protein
VTCESAEIANNVMVGTLAVWRVVRGRYSETCAIASGR